VLLALALAYCLGYRAGLRLGYRAFQAYELAIDGGR
jgi:hypothetical protein